MKVIALDSLGRLVNVDRLHRAGRIRWVVRGSAVRYLLAHPRSAEVLNRLESYRSGTPRLSKHEMELRFNTWQVWELAERSYVRAARLLTIWRERPVSRQLVYYVVKRMRDEGILDGIR